MIGDELLVQLLGLAKLPPQPIDARLDDLGLLRPRLVAEPVIVDEFPALWTLAIRLRDFG